MKHFFADYNNLQINCILVSATNLEEKSTKLESEEKSSGLDVVDQGCVGCSTKDLRQAKEDVSLSISSDDETEQAISLDINKKSNSTSYRGKQFTHKIEWNI